MNSFLLLVPAGLIAGIMNAVAGGGSFITFPALVYAGIPPLNANASSTVALFPGSLVASWEYRKFTQPVETVPLFTILVLTFTGGCTGALLLLYTPSAYFSAAVPWLLLTGSITFAFGKQVGILLRRKVKIGTITILVAQFLLGVYGGYFGGAVGIMMMAVWSIFGMSDVKVLNANKNLMVVTANAIAVIVFSAAGIVEWRETFIMMLATITGGYLGAHYSKSMNPVLLKRVIICLNFIITLLFFIKYWL